MDGLSRATVKGGDPLERLAKLRTVFFPGDHTLGQRTFSLTRQSQGADPTFAKYRENVRWDLGGVTFVTLHVTGSNNGLGRTPEGDAEYGNATRPTSSGCSKDSHTRRFATAAQS